MLTLEKVGQYERDGVVKPRKAVSCQFALAGGFDSTSGGVAGWLSFGVKIQLGRDRRDVRPNVGIEPSEQEAASGKSAGHSSFRISFS